MKFSEMKPGTLIKFKHYDVGTVLFLVNVRILGDMPTYGIRAEHTYLSQSGTLLTLTWTDVESYEWIFILSRP